MLRITKLINTLGEIREAFELNQYCIVCGTLRGCEVQIENHNGNYKVTLEDQELKGFHHILKSGSFEEVVDYYLSTLGCF